MDDSYPFYGKLDRKLQEAQLDYAEERGGLIRELEEIRRETTDAMQSAKDDLGKRRGEHASILENRSRALRAYDQHIAYLERAGNALLSIYREANLEARKDKGPKHFKQAWKLQRPPIETGPPPDVLPQEKLEAAVTRAQATLDKRMKEIHAEYEKAFSAYRGLEDIIGGLDGQTATTAQ